MLQRRNVYTIRDRLWELNCGILGLLLSEGAAFVITSALKNAAGKPRPDLIDRCQPIPGSQDPPVYGLSNSSICTQTDHAILKDGFRSFPSGHSSSAFSGLFYLSLYLAGKLHLMDSRGEVWKTFLVLLPTVAAALIAISRIMDARHHPFDVISGSLLGILAAYGSYRQYFPSLSEPWKKGRAHPMRTWGRDPPIKEDTVNAQQEASEPLRTPGVGLPSDEHGASDSGPRDHNIFRQQLSRSQRQRDRHPQSAHENRHGDGYWSSTSSVHSHGAMEDGEAFEMTSQPVYRPPPAPIPPDPRSGTSPNQRPIAPLAYERATSPNK